MSQYLHVFWDVNQDINTGSGKGKGKVVPVFN
jgi:hypothetical protein